MGRGVVWPYRSKPYSTIGREAMKIRHLILIALFGASLIVASEWYLDAYETSIRRDEMGQALVIIEELQERLKDSEELRKSAAHKLAWSQKPR